MNLRYGESIVLSRGVSPDNRYIELYSQNAWAEKVEDIENSFPEGKLKAKFVRWYVSTAESLELDTQNRVRLPKHLIEYAGLEKEVVLLGCGDRIEIWDKAALEASESLDESDFDEVFNIMNEYRQKKAGE